jgi:hypothetical protein
MRGIRFYLDDCPFCQSMRELLLRMKEKGQLASVTFSTASHRSAETGQDDYPAPTLVTPSGTFEGEAEISLFFLQGHGYYVNDDGTISDSDLASGH